MIEHELPLDENMSESFPAMTFDFPYVWFWGEMEAYVGGYVPWHWHEEPEFCHIIKGEVEYHLPQQVYALKAGDAIYVNSNVLHMIRPHNGCEGAVILPQVFNKLLLIGYHRSAFDMKYFRPIINAQNLPCYVMRHDNEEDAQMINLLDICYRCAEKEEFGYELQVRNYISSLWLKLYRIVEPQLRAQDNEQDKTNLRLKQMLAYIGENYSEKIMLKEIAASACISERECIRCFRKYMQLTPGQYLQEYRIDAAANLLMHTDLPVTEIALQCGFENSSYFSKIFKQLMHCTPKMYRDTSRQNDKFDRRAVETAEHLNDLFPISLAKLPQKGKI